MQNVLLGFNFHHDRAFFANTANKNRGVYCQAFGKELQSMLVEQSNEQKLPKKTLSPVNVIKTKPCHSQK